MQPVAEEAANSQVLPDVPLKHQLGAGELDDELHQRRADRRRGGGDGARDHGTCEAGEPASAGCLRVPRHVVVGVQAPRCSPASRCSRANS